MEELIAIILIYFGHLDVLPVCAANWHLKEGKTKLIFVRLLRHGLLVWKCQKWRRKEKIIGRFFQPTAFSLSTVYYIMHIQRERVKVKCRKKSLPKA